MAINTLFFARNFMGILFEVFEGLAVYFFLNNKSVSAFVSWLDNLVCCNRISCTERHILAMDSELIGS
jgi:hypothetical protein